MKKPWLLVIFLSSCTPQKQKIRQAATEDEPACTDPYYTTVIDGKTYSGSTATAQQAYLEMEGKLKKILYDESLSEKDRWRRVKNIQEIMDSLNKFRCKCSRYARGGV